MTTPAPMAPPAIDSARDYLLDLGRAVDIARLYRDAAVLEEQRCVMDGGQHRPGHRRTGAQPADRAMNCPIGLVLSGHHGAVAALVADTRERHAQAVAWHTHAATLTLRAVLAGQPISARELERHTTLRDAMPGQADEWPDTDRPPIPDDPAELATGQHHLDVAVAAAWEPLRDLYRADDSLLSYEDHEANDEQNGVRLTDADLDYLSGLSISVMGLPDVMATYAGAVAQAALYCHT